MNPVVDTVALFGELNPVTGQIAQITRPTERHKAGANQAMRQQLGQPFAVACVRLLTKNGLHLILVGQNQLEVAFQ